MADTPQKPVVSAEQRQALIREAAHKRYVQRGGAEGYDLEDWLAAEADIDALLGQASEVESLARGAT